MELNQFEKNFIVGGVIFYNPSEEIIRNSLNNSSLFDKFIIVWNSPKKDIYYLLCEYKVEKKIKEIENNLNLGVTGGLNKIFEYAFNKKIDYVLFLDQDSQIIIDRIQLVKSFELLNQNKKFACIGFQREKTFPKYYSHNSKYIYETPKISKASVINYSFMHSGCVYSTIIWNKLNGFRQDFFIEGTDTEYCLRAEKEGFDLYTFNINLMKHDSGVEKNIHITKNFYFKIGYHPPWRIYLQYRNNIYLILKYIRKNFIWSLKAFFLIISIKTFQVLIAEKKKGILLLTIFAGIVDGIISAVNDQKNMKNLFYDTLIKDHLKFKIPKFNR